MSTADEPIRRWVPGPPTNYNRHLPVYSRDWSDVIETTKHGGLAKYHPSLTISEIKKFEMEYDPKRFLWRGRYGGTFYTNFDRIIGASNGEETTIAIIKHGSCGAVHGQPLDKNEFVRLWNKFREGEKCPV